VLVHPASNSETPGESVPASPVRQFEDLDIIGEGYVLQSIVDGLKTAKATIYGRQNQDRPENQPELPSPSDDDSANAAMTSKRLRESTGSIAPHIRHRDKRRATDDELSTSESPAATVTQQLKLLLSAFNEQRDTINQLKESDKHQRARNDEF